MFKEIIISIIIIVSIISLDIVTQNYTKQSMQETRGNLISLKEKIKNEDNNLIDNIEDIFKSWEERREKLSYFIEHDELEKVGVNLTNIKSFIEESDFKMAINSIEEAEYILEQIKEKNAFILENIF